MVEGQYVDTYKRDSHITQYSNYIALCVRWKPVKVYRDNNKMEKKTGKYILDMDPNTIDEGYFGTNIHHAKSNGKTDLVGPYSAGCQVFGNVNDFNDFMKNIVDKQIDKIKCNKFTYTLLLEKDIE